MVSITLFIISPYADELVTPKKIGLLTLVWFIINFFTVFLGISAEMLIIKIFETDDKSKGSMLLDMGWTIGGFLSYNLFVPLNRVNWLNKNIFTNNPISKPILSHSTMMLILAFCTITYGVTIFIFVGEKMIEDHIERPNFLTLFKRIIKFFTTETMRNFLIFILLMRIFRFFIIDTIGLKFITHGISKTTIVNIDTITFPLYIICSILFMKFMVKGKIMQWYSWMMIYAVMLVFATFLILKDLENNNSTNRTTWLLVIMSVLGRFCVEGPFLMGFINLITPEEIGSTFITFQMCWQNITYLIPSTIGMKITHHKLFNFDYQVMTALIIQITLVVVLMPYCRTLDTKHKEE